MDKMTIHRALAELKLVDARIEKGIALVNAVGMAQKDKKVNGVIDKDEYQTDAASKLRSVSDLIERKSRIKSAIVKANGSTMVEINGKQMTIADAINYKTVIGFKKALIKHLSSQRDAAIAQLNKNNDLVEQNALKLAEAALQKDNVKINDGDAVAITEPYLEKNRFELIDPLNIKEYIESEQEKIDGFEAEVDAVLSEINATTIIEI